MKKLLLNISLILVAFCFMILIVSFSVIIDKLVAQDYKMAWIWMIPFIGSILYGIYSFGITFYLFDEESK